MIDATYVSDDRSRFVRHFDYWPSNGHGDHYAVYEVVGELPDTREPWVVNNRRIGVFRTAHEAINLAKEGVTR